MEDKTSRFRLRSSAFERKDENEEKVNPKRVIFLSVEGDNTERNYFEHYQSYIESSRDDSFVRIEVLRCKRGAGYSSPKGVLDLLHEYISLRQGDVMPEELPQAFTEMYSKDEIKQYLEKPKSFSRKQLRQFKDELLKASIDIEYRRYLKKYNNDGDYFAIIIDKDSNGAELLHQIAEKCRNGGFGCYLSNPCFEFWLLLHLCDVKTEYEGKFEYLLNNEYVIGKRTYMDMEIMRLAHHKKGISSSVFTNTYLPRIPQAIASSKEFACDFDKIIDNLGTNLPDLFKIIGLDETIDK